MKSKVRKLFDQLAAQFGVHCGYFILAPDNSLVLHSTYPEARELIRDNQTALTHAAAVATSRARES